jgi:hypothetical protein
VNSYPPHASQLGAISHTLTLSLEEAASGKVASIRIPRVDICVACGGTGQSWRDDNGTCANCNSKGSFEYEKALEVRIPPGVETGSRLRIAGEGNMDASQSARADLFITINVRRHETFERRGKDLHCFVKLTQGELTMGTQVIIPTLLDGQKLLRIPPGTAGGTAFRLGGLGLGYGESDERGDLFVKVGTQTPTPASHARTESPFATQPSPKRSEVSEFFLKNFRDIAIAVGIILVLGFLALNNRSNKNLTSQNLNTTVYPSPVYPLPTRPPPSYVPTPMPSPARLPFALPNGANITPPQGPRGDNSMTIVNGGYWDIAVKIVSRSSQKTRRFVYVRADSTAVVKNLAREVCLLRWESGNDWDTSARRFLGARAIHQFDQDFDLRKVRYTIHFTPSPTGTLRETPIDESEFDDK